MSLSSGVLVTVALLCSNTFLLQAQNQALPSILSLLQRHGDLSEFNSLVRESSFLNNSAPLTALTIFAPSNEAIRHYRENGGNLDNQTLLFHFLAGFKLTSELNEGPLPTAFVDSKYQIWITTYPNSSRIFVNDAEIDSRRRNYQITNSMGINQTLHVINRVLVPNSFGGGGSGSQLDCPNANQFLANSSFHTYYLHCPMAKQLLANSSLHYEWMKMDNLVALLKKDNSFEAPGGHTFFIPVDSSFDGIDMDTVDGAILDGHVIPNHVLLLPQTLELQESGTRYATASSEYSSNRTIIIQLRKGDDDEENGVIVRSSWMSTTSKLDLPGIVEAEVLQRNIPVSNGVLHLISKPLGLPPTITTYEMLSRSKEGGSMNRFFWLLRKYLSTHFLNEIRQRRHKVTIFVPNKAALDQNIALINDMKFKSYGEIEECLRRHIILDVVWSTNMTQEKVKNGLNTMGTDAQMSFAYDSDREQFTVSNCGGVAHITQPNIATRDGVIHKIDAFLCGKHTCPTAIDDLLKFDDLTDFHNLLTLKASKFLSNLTMKANWTLLVPTNRAIQRLVEKGGLISQESLLYHFIDGVKSTQDFEQNVNSPLNDQPGHLPPIWVTKSGSSIFLNDAQIDSQRSNLQFGNSSEMNQAFHVIDRFLETATDNDFPNPNAFKFMTLFKYFKFGQWNNHSHTIKEWDDRIFALRRMDIFKWSGGHTFFVPVDKAFETIPIVAVNINEIESHVVLNHVLFLRPPSSSDDLLPDRNKTMYTTADSSTLIQIQHVNHNGMEDQYFVESVADNLPGIVQAEVVLGNIPVNNGVIHLISKPFTLVTNVFKTLEIDRLSAEFYTLFSEHASPQLKGLLYRPPNPEGITVFVPSNLAMVSKSGALQIIKRNATLLDDFLRCHFVLGTLWTNQFSNESFSKESMASTKAKLVFKSINLEGQSEGSSKTFTVGVEDGNNSSIKILMPDLRAINGAIHLIDGVLECSVPIRQED